MTILYVNGCSHTAGAELVGPGQVDTSTDPKDDNRKLSWSGQLHSEHFKTWEYMNNAYSGSNNESIALNTINDIEQLNLSGKKDIRVLISWTYPGRYHFETQDNMDFYKSKAKFFIGYDLMGDTQAIPFAEELWQGLNSFHNELDDQKTFIRDYTLLSNYLKFNKIKYAMIHFAWYPKPQLISDRYIHLYKRYEQDPSVLHNQSAVQWLDHNKHLDNVDGRLGHYTYDAHRVFARSISGKIKQCLG
tara:strand:- start:802 stop:1539 length:738 start_codon:yes stop_codon:yes gene_type:complete